MLKQIFAGSHTEHPWRCSLVDEKLPNFIALEKDNKGRKK
jgi:hypothetical protein